MVIIAGKHLLAALAAFFGAVVLSASRAEVPCTLPPGKEDFESRTIALPGGAELTLRWIETGKLTIDQWEGTYLSKPLRVPVDGFWIGVCEVTQKQWKSVMGDNPSYFRGEELPTASRRAELPVECVSWDDCTEFCRRTGLRLPTEMEWLRANTAFWTRQSWTLENSEGRTHPVGRPGESGTGLPDMNGNVCEWCADRFAPWPEPLPANYAGPSEGTDRVACGESWCEERWPGSRFAKERLHLPPGCRYNNLGFRVALTPAGGGRGD